MSKQDATNGLILETFRLNGRLLVAGDSLVSDLGLTSARWQVLGAMAAFPVPLSVAQIARNMGLSRQAVQRLVNEMERDALVRFEPNPFHRRAKFVLLAPQGKAAYESAMKRQGPWACNLAVGLTTKEIEAAAIILRKFRRRLEDQVK
jgi:DNA-binding MarR family transcriptional regulator